MANKFGVFVSLPNVSILKAKEKDIAFAADKDMVKIKSDHFVQNGQTLQFDHGIGYFPIFFPYRYGGILGNSRRCAVGYSSIGDFITKHTVQTTGFVFVGYNPGFS